MTGGVVWLSTSTETRGGVASYVRTMQQTPLWDLWRVRHISTHRDGSVSSRLVAFAAGAASFTWELAVRRPALVHLHMASYGSFARKSLIAWIARFAGLPVVIHVHGGGFQEFFQSSPRPVQAYIRTTMNHADVLIALGESWARRLEQIAPEVRIMVVPNAVKPREPVAQPGSDKPVRVLFVGQLNDDKGAFNLIEAWSRLGNVRAELVLAGAGDLTRASSRIAQLELQECVRLTGWVEPDEVEALLRTSQVLVLPSRNEGQPMAVLEAMANGLCVIATDVGGIPDLVDEECGVLIPADDIPALVAALREVVADKRRREELGEKALKRVRDTLDVDIAWRVLDDLYRELAR